MTLRTLIILMAQMQIGTLLFAQITINHLDMPAPGDTFRISTANIGSGINLDTTGANFFWDFSDLTITGNRLDSFMEVDATPASYNSVFNNPLDPERRATIAIQPPPQGNSMPQVEITEVYNYFQESVAKFCQVGFAAKINDVPTPIKYDYPEILYVFPLQYTLEDSSLSAYNIAIPTIGYYGQTRKRINHIDGWGSIKTRLGTFLTVRVYSELFLTDTIYYDAYSYGTKFNRTEKEYRWLTDNIGVPIFMATVTNNTKRAYFVDSDTVSQYITEMSDTEPSVTVGPNPSNTSFRVTYFTPDNKNTYAEVYDIFGRLVFRKECAAGFQGFTFGDNLAPGNYVLRLGHARPIPLIKLDN